MDVVPNTGPIGSRIVPSKHHQLLSFPSDDLLDEWEQVVGVADWLIAQQPRFMAATRVKISEGNYLPVGVTAAQRSQ